MLREPRAHEGGVLQGRYRHGRRSLTTAGSEHPVGTEHTAASVDTAAVQGQQLRSSACERGGVAHAGVEPRAQWGKRPLLLLLLGFELSFSSASPKLPSTVAALFAELSHFLSSSGASLP